MERRPTKRRARRAIRAGLAAVGLALGGAASALAADFSDPTWPCVQRKVGELSLGLMWPHPIAAEAEPTEEMETLAETLALRRIEEDELAGHVEAGAARLDRDA
ncbi:MAG: hypothetical protein AAGF90_12650, partial [Pseudomonadota bacterium]